MSEKQFYFESEFEVKSYDIDVVGHVNNIVYIRWLEDIRMNFLNKFLPYNDLMNKGISPVLVNTQIEYLQPIKMFDEVIAESYISDVKGPRLFMEFEFYVGERLMAKAKQTGIFFDVHKQRPVRPPEEFIKLWKNYEN